MAKIYHYTTIDTLALIMLNKTIRFNRLDLVDDKEESLFGSGPYDMKVSKNVFVSCWTKDQTENRDLWERYTKNNKGVRIALDEDMFQTYQINDHYKSFFPNWFNVIDDCIFLFDEAKLYDVQYVEDNEKRIRNAVFLEEYYINIMINELGIYKKKMDWEQQNESRFKLFAFPSTPKVIEKIKSENVNNTFDAIKIIISLLMQNHQISLQYYDMPLKKGALDNIEVTMGPKTTDEDKIKVRRLLYPCLINRFFSKRRILDSCLKER